MKKTLIASLAAAAFVSSTAFAADLAVKAPVMKAPPAPVASWTGCYLDAGGGYGMYNQDHFIENVPPIIPLGQLDATSTSGGRGWLGRFGGGCDLQLTGAGLSNWVIGVFGDYDVMDIKGTAQDFAISVNEKENNAWYAGARLGYLVTPSLLTYVSGGYTETHFGSATAVGAILPSTPLGAFLASQTYHGWFIGGGTEYALNLSWLPIQGLFWRNEYRYASFQSRDVPFILTTGGPTGTDLHSTKFNQTITSSLVWRFNWAGPVAARY
jgi:outer membrane immunogenic protein